MASLQQKRPSISNWFSSLRRQPKNKKSASLYNTGDKQFQRSCIDLSSNSTFYVTPLPGDANSSSSSIKRNKSSFMPTIKQKQANYKRNTSISAGSGGGGGVGDSGIGIDSSIDNLHDAEDDRRGLVSGKRVSQLCSRCCCNILGSQQEQEHSPSSTPPTPTKKVKPLTPSSVLTLTPSFVGPFASVATYNIPATSYINAAHESEPTTPQTPTTSSSTISSQTVIETGVKRDVKFLRLPSDEPNTIILKKRSELKHTTTTTTTRTLIISRPVELLLNERGEIISRRPATKIEKATRSNSLGCVLDDEYDDSAESCTSYSPRTLASASLGDHGDDDEFRFIDDSSTSQSETERNSQNSGMQRLSDKSLKESSVYQSAGQNNNKNSNNNDSDSLCDVCKNVIELNRTNSAQNDAVIMRNKQIKDELCEVASEMEALSVPEDSKHSNKDKQMSIGRKKFNMDPKKGIEHLVEHRLLRHDPQDVAHFLYKGEGLNKTAIGDYLGEKNDFNEDVLKAFVALHDFTNLILVQALRQFLWSFRLPGEAQKIDRMMECFAQRYCQLNPDIFTNTDTCYVLSFAIIMLNTSLHNPSVKDKPSVEQFITMNRGINNGGDLPRGLLESLFESIRTEPFKIPQDDGNDLMHTFFNPDKEGWLWKQGGRYKSWKRRWFILNDNCLYYFEYTTDKEPRGIIPLENIAVREIHDRSKPHCFELFATGGAEIIKACKTDSEGKVVEGKHSVYRMSAATEEDQLEWIERLTQSISHNPFYDILVQRKKKALSKS